MPETDDTRQPTPGDPRFTRGLVLDVVKTLQSHGYEPVTTGQLVELQLHLWYFLHGDTSSRCMGGVR
jgi:hypothetical protein